MTFTQKLYQRDAFTLGGEAVVVDRFTNAQGQHVVRLEATYFHAQGGGQPADVGVIGDARVLRVVHAEGGAVDHIVDHLGELEVGARVPFEIDADARTRNARAHTLGHAIAHALEAAHPGLRAVGGHHWPEQARVEFEGDTGGAPNDAVHRELERALLDAIERRLAVRPILDAPDGVRRVAIGDFPPVPCGGTHVRDLGELGGVAVRRIRRKSGKLRVSYALLD